MITVCVMCGKIIHGASHPAACGACASRIVPLVPKPTIKLRIRVGVTESGEWMAIGGNIGAGDHDTAFKLGEHVSGRSFIAWHWITAEVPMPEVEQGETKGEVEHG